MFPYIFIIHYLGYKYSIMKFRLLHSWNENNYYAEGSIQ